MITKTCHCCKKDLPNTNEYFNKAKDRFDRLAKTCKECVNKYQRDNRWKKLGVENPPEKYVTPQAKTLGNKVCIKCKKEYPAANFCVDRTMTSGLHSYCKKCFKEYRKEIMLERVKNNKCYMCGKDKIENSSRFCIDCWMSNTSARRLGKSYKKELKLIAEKQKYKCPYTQDPLIPGKNMSLEHIHAASISLENKKDINNVTWCSFWANSAKSNLTPEEFYINCKKVVTNYEKNNGFKIITIKDIYD